MKLANYEVPKLGELLFNMKLKGKDSRMRTRLVNEIDNYIKNTLNKEEIQLLMEYGVKDENGELIEGENGFVLIPEKVNDYHTEMNNLINENFVIEENETNKDMLLSVANSIINCDLELNSELAKLWDKWCDQFEDVINRYNT